MNKQKVIRYFGDVQATAKAFDISHQAVYRWDEIIPKAKALEAEKLSHGTLKYSARAYK